VTNGFLLQEEKAFCVVLNYSIMTFWSFENLRLLGLTTIYKPGQKGNLGWDKS